MKGKIVKAGIGYTVGNILLQCMGIFTLPLYTRLLSTGEYGKYAVFMSYAAILLSVVSCALHTSVRSAKVEYGSKINDYVSSISIVYFFGLSVLVVISLLSPGVIRDLLSLNRKQLLLLSVYTFSTSIMNLYNTWLSLEYSYKRYIILSAINSITSLSISLLLMFTIFNSDRLMGRLIGVTFASVVVASVALFRIYKTAKPKYNRDYLSFGLKYSTPLIAHGVAQTLLAQFDRVMINSIVGAAEAGIYSFAGTVKTLLNVISNSLNTVWATWFFDEMSKGNTKQIKRRGKEYCLLVLLFAIGALCIAPEVVKLLGSRDYWEAMYLAPPMVLDSYVMFVYAIVVQGEYYAKKTNNVLIGTILAAIINVITNYIFITKYGYVAAAYTTLFAYTCYLIFHIIISRRLIGFCIISIKQHIFQGIILAVISAFCLLYMQIWLLRWAFALCSVVIIGTILLKMIAQDGDVNLKKIASRLPFFNK